MRALPVCSPGLRRDPALIPASAPSELVRAARMRLERAQGQQAVEAGRGPEQSREPVEQLSLPLPVLVPDSVIDRGSSYAWWEKAVETQGQGQVQEWGWIPAAVEERRQPEPAEVARLVAQVQVQEPVVAGRRAGWGRERE